MDNMANYIAQIICETDLPNSNGFGTVRLGKKEAEILATKLAAGMCSQGENVKDFEEQLKTEKTEKAKYDFAVTAYRNVLAELEQTKNEYDALKYSDPKYVWHKTKDGEFPDKEVLCCCDRNKKQIWRRRANPESSNTSRGNVASRLYANLLRYD